MTKKLLPTVIALEKPETKMLSCRGEVLPAEKAKGRQYTLSEAYSLRNKKPKEYEPGIPEVTTNGVVITNAHKETRKHKMEPEPIEVVEKPAAFHTDHRGVTTIKSVADYTVN